METYSEQATEARIPMDRNDAKKTYTAEDFEYIERDELIFHLWRIIDNIDTFGDMAKSNDKAFRSLTEGEQKKRWSHASQEFIDYLYDKYYHRSQKNGAPHNIEII